MWRILEVTFSGYNLLTPSTVNTDILFLLVYSGDHNYLCWILYHLHCWTRSHHYSLYQLFCFIFFKYLFPEVSCSIEINTKLSLFLFPFLPLESFLISNWGTSNPLWWNWLHYYFSSLNHMPLNITTTEWGSSITLILCRIIGHISWQAKYF